MLFKRALRFSLLVRRNPSVVHDANIRNLDRTFRFRDVALDRRREIVGKCDYLARCQRAGKGAEQSSPYGRDHMIERSGILFLGFDAVKLCNSAVHAVGDRLIEMFDVRLPYGRYVLIDTDVTGMDDVSHGRPPFSYFTKEAVANGVDRSTMPQSYCCNSL